MSWILAIPALPLLIFAVLILCPRAARNKLIYLSILGMVAVFALSCMALYQTVLAYPGDVLTNVWHYGLPLAGLSGQELALGISLTTMSACVIPVVSFVSLCVQIFSLGYMHGDERIGWYYAVVSLFTAAMLGFVLAGDLLLAFMSWEIMGLCSYFLIGFWFTETEPREASIKAFIVTRVGDLGFFFALIVLFKTFGTFDLHTILTSITSVPTSVALWAGIGLLVAAMGKSAQMPLHVWLPDAMAGPTPASALIHAATMVAAGVLLIARTMPLFQVVPALMMATLIIGLATSIVAGLIACVQHDIKKVLAYSTVSQLGLMFCALGVAGVTAALFHLVTHAFFKALLFLGSGFIIHAVGSQDMREMGGLRKKLPITWITFLIGTLALSGVAPLSGFFSKDEIVHALLHAHLTWAAAGVFAASILTAFYMTRLYFKVFEGTNRGECHHEHGMSMLIPLVLLALITIGAGWLSPTFAEFLGGHGMWPSISLVAMSTLIAALGIGSAAYLFGRPSKVNDMSTPKPNAGYNLLVNKFYFDHINDAVFVRGTKGLSRFVASFDRLVVDGIVNALGYLAQVGANTVKMIQTGKLQTYQRLTFCAVVLFVFCILFFATRGV